jgi:hypothetical protein
LKVNEEQINPDDIGSLDSYENIIQLENIQFIIHQQKSMMKEYFDKLTVYKEEVPYTDEELESLKATFGQIIAD